MDSQQISNIQNAVLQKVQQGSSQSVGLLKFLHQKCTPAQLQSNEFLVFIVTTVLQATLHGRLDVLQTLLALGHTLDFPMTIKQTDGQPPQKMAPLEVLCYNQPHKLQQPKFREVALFLFKNCKFEGYPAGTARSLAFVLQELQDFDGHRSYFEAMFAHGSRGVVTSGSDGAASEFGQEGPSVLPEFDLGGVDEGSSSSSSDEKTQDFILNFESESVGVEPNYFAQLIAVREKWWARQRQRGGSTRSGGSRASGSDSCGEQHHALSRWNEKIAMKKIFAERVRDKQHLVPTLYSVYMDELTGGSSGGTPGKNDGDDSDATVAGAVSSAVAHAFESDPQLERVHVKPSHMCRGLGITSFRREEVTAARNAADKSGTALVLNLNKDLFRGKLSRELAPLALSTARRGVIVEPHVAHGSEIRITCVFGRPVAAVSYRPSDSSGKHDIMYKAKESRQSTTRRVISHLDSLDAARIARMYAGSGGGGNQPEGSSNPKKVSELETKKSAPPRTWEKMCSVAQTVAAGTDFLRVDFFLEEGTGEFWVNEMDPTYAFITAIGFHGYVACDCIGFLWFYVWREKIRSRKAAKKRAEVTAKVAEALKLRDAPSTNTDTDAGGAGP